MRCCGCCGPLGWNSRAWKTSPALDHQVGNTAHMNVENTWKGVSDSDSAPAPGMTTLDPVVGTPPLNGRVFLQDSLRNHFWAFPLVELGCNFQGKRMKKDGPFSSFSVI